MEVWFNQRLQIHATTVWASRSSTVGMPSVRSPPSFFGIATVLVPFFTMQPAFGLGVAASKTPNPNKARLKSLMTHTVFGVGLYVWAYLLSHVLFHP